MSCEGWKKVRLGEVGKIITGKTPKTLNKENYGGNILFLTPSDDMKVKKVYDTNKRITMQGLNEVKNSLLPENSVCVSCIGSDLGKVVITTQETVTNQQINSIIPNINCEYNFLYYSMLILGKKLNFISKTSTAVPIVNKSSFSNYEVNLPPIQEQKAIAATLSALDDKIELNNKINKNLEEMAQAIFKSWFVHFELFQDGEFVESELGLIPKGWRVGNLADLGNIVGGSTPSKSKPEYYTENGIPWITPRDLSRNSNKFISCGENDITQLGLKNSSAKEVPQGTVLFSSRAPIGYIAIAKNTVTTNQGFKSVVPNIDVGSAYIYYFLKENLTVIENMASGSTFKEVSGTTMKSVKAIIPDEKSLGTFNDIITPLFNEQAELEQESQKLTNLRDTLLPKLMSGEIRVPLEFSN